MTSVAYGLKSPHSLRISFSPTARRRNGRLSFFHGIRQTSESALWIIHIEGVYRRAKLIISRPAIYRNRSQCNGSFYLQTVGTGSRIRRRTITAGTTITSTALCTANDSAATGATRRGNWWSARCRPWSKRRLIGLNKYICIIIYFLFHQIHHGRGYWISPLDRVLYQSISLLHIYIYTRYVSLIDIIFGQNKSYWSAHPPWLDPSHLGSCFRRHRLETDPIPYRFSTYSIRSGGGGILNSCAVRLLSIRHDRVDYRQTSVCWLNQVEGLIRCYRSPKIQNFSRRSAQLEPGQRLGGGNSSHQPQS